MLPRLRKLALDTFTEFCHWVVGNFGFFMLITTIVHLLSYLDPIFSAISLHTQPPFPFTHDIDGKALHEHTNVHLAHPPFLACPALALVTCISLVSCWHNAFSPRLPAHLLGNTLLVDPEKLCTSTSLSSLGIDSLLYKTSPNFAGQTYKSLYTTVCWTTNNPQESFWII